MVRLGSRGMPGIPWWASVLAGGTMCRAGQGDSATAGREPACGPRRAQAWPSPAEIRARGRELHICSDWSSWCDGAAWEGAAWSNLPAGREVRRSRACTGSWQNPTKQNFQVENKGIAQGKKTCELYHMAATQRSDCSLGIQIFSGWTSEVMD